MLPLVGCQFAYGHVLGLCVCAICVIATSERRK